MNPDSPSSAPHPGVTIASDYLIRRGYQPFPFQQQTWAAYLAGESGLIHAPTGTGKTLAAWLGPVVESMLEKVDSGNGRSRKRSESPPLRVLWITPMRALAQDTAEALQRVLDDLNMPWSLETRTGDTSSAVRSRQSRRLPTALITTPESLSLLLTRPNAVQLFDGLRLVVVDEWHELLSTKRGVQTELGLARLRRWQPGLRLFGLSATMGNLETALQTLLGWADFATGEVPAGRLVRANIPAPLRIDSILPANIERFPWAGHLGLRLLPQVIAEIEASRSALVFTNTRSQTEIWYQAILEQRPDWAGIMALHHGSLDPETRQWVVDNLRSGKLRCVISTSSLDLGVDFTPVDRVFQVGSPKGVGRLLQRAGRSGHQPGVESRMTCVPAQALELVEYAAARAAIQAGEIESRNPLEKPLDVLAQHLVTIALGGGFESDDLYREVRTTRAYRSLTQDEWQWALDFVTRGGPALKSYPMYTRVTKEGGRYQVVDKDIAQMHRMSIGTITSDVDLQVKYLKGGRIGQIEESFISRLRPGNRFTLGGKVLELVRVRDMTAWVRRASNKKGVVPRWMGGRLPLSNELASAIRRQLDQASRGIYDSPEMTAVRPLFELQARWSQIPSVDTLLIERVETRDGHHLFFYPFEGLLVHQGLSALLAYRLAKLSPITFTLTANDYGFEMLSSDPAPLEAALAGGLFSQEHLLDDILASVNAAEMARRQFRDIARISGLAYARFPGGIKTARQLQASSGLIFDVLQNYDPENLLLAQSQREVLEGQLESSRLRVALQSIRAVQVDLRDVVRPTPLSFPLLVDRMRQTVSSETIEDRIKRMQVRLEEEAEKLGSGSKRRRN
jgi:ATP-dependent helicase Lhr and Lhr-like helicase